jgi:hypothetical protein
MTIEQYTRPKVIQSKTEAITLDNCGTLYLTFGYQEDVEGRVVEVMAIIGKTGICSNILLNSFAKAMSMLLQSPTPRYKIVEKVKKQFKGISCQNGKEKSCISLIAEKLIKELE